jgi:hypothetical protein
MVIAFLDDFQEFSLVILRERRDKQVVKNQHLALGDLSHELLIATVMVGNGYILEQSWQSLVEDCGPSRHAFWARDMTCERFIPRASL